MKYHTAKPGMSSGACLWVLQFCQIYCGLMYFDHSTVLNNQTNRDYFSLQVVKRGFRFSSAPLPHPFP